MANARRSAQLIAVVDDDPLIREAVEGLLRSIDYEAATFASAEEYLASERRREVNCIVTDIQMHGRSGLELQAMVSAEPNSPSIIFLTGLPPEDPRRRAAKAQSPYCLAKPVAPDELVRCIEKALADAGRR